MCTSRDQEIQQIQFAHMDDQNTNCKEKKKLLTLYGIS